MCLRCCGSIPAGFRSIALLCGHVGRRRAHSAIVRDVCVCCLPIASRCGCRSMSGMPTPSRCVVAVHDQMSVVLRPHGHNGSARSWLAIAVVGPQWLPQPVGEGVGKRGYDSIAFLRVFVSLRWWALRGRRVCTAWRHTPVMHDDPDCHPDRDAFTLTGPSPNCRWGLARGHP